ncbi:MAG: RluA family pseudouridine synthase [Candidatus Omnitrophota bacterium]|jgi:23S rRNA pseudouridine1911/1915/1917 synthase
MNIPIIYEDEWLLIIDKPAGLLTIPTPKNEPRTLTSILNDDLKEKGSLYRLRPCHRLDRDTSGLIIYAKGKAVQKKMAELFRQRKVKKAYAAFVQGNLAQNQGEIKKAIEGRNALTKYRVKERKKSFTLVEAYPLTGRTNQLRIHFKFIGHPILGERKYAFRRDFKLKAKRLCLHAKGLEFIHPINGRLITLSSELPAEMKEILMQK